MNRRSLLKGSFAVGVGALLGGCGAPTTGPGSTSPTLTTAQPREPTEDSSVPSPKVLLAYFSRAGENYYYGGRTVLAVGNTSVVADMISSTVRVDTYRIEAADPYPESYAETVARNVDEQNSDARPAIAGLLPDVETYDTVLLGSGIWNVRPPMIMRTFVESVDLSGKTILPFVTYAVSGLGSTIEDYTQLCPRSTIGDGLAVRGEEANNASADVTGWLERAGLLQT